MRWAQENQMQIRFHTLFWHQIIPIYIKRGDFGWDDVFTFQNILMKRYGSLVSSEGKKIVFGWDVVNEAIDEPDDKGHVQWRMSPFYKKWGEEFFVRVYQQAHQWDPRAILFFNEYGLELPGPKAEFALKWLKKMREKKVPIHAVGLQTHVFLLNNEQLKLIEENIRRFTDLGFKVMLSELDVRLFQSKAEWALLSLKDRSFRLERQGHVYAELTKICLRNNNCLGITFWGLSDRDSWTRRLFHLNFEKPHLFDEILNPKPAYWGVFQAMRGTGN